MIRAAQGGDVVVRDRVVRLFAGRAARIASRAVGRYVEAGRDDEVSIALMAVDEAISHFDPARGTRFLPFAERVIRRRLIDHLRRRGRTETPFSALALEDEEGQAQVPALNRRSLALADEEAERLARREEIRRYGERLERFGLSLEALVHATPRHRDARRGALAVGRLVATDDAMRDHLLAHGTLPLKALERRTGITRKTLERHRRYIVGIALVGPEDFPLMFEHLRAAAPSIAG
jgi:RNA polymerase sigma factor